MTRRQAGANRRAAPGRGYRGGQLVPGSARCGSWTGKRSSHGQATFGAVAATLPTRRDGGDLEHCLRQAHARRSPSRYAASARLRYMPPSRSASQAQPSAIGTVTAAAATRPLPRTLPRAARQALADSANT